MPGIHSFELPVFRLRTAGPPRRPEGSLAPATCAGEDMGRPDMGRAPRAEVGRVRDRSNTTKSVRTSSVYLLYISSKNAFFTKKNAVVTTSFINMHACVHLRNSAHGSCVMGETAGAVAACW